LTSQCELHVVRRRGRRRSRPSRVGDIECTGPQTVYTASATATTIAARALPLAAAARFALGTTVSTATDDDATNRSTLPDEGHGEDTTPPSVTITFAPAAGWGQTATCIPIPVTVTAADVCDSAPSIECQAWSVDSRGNRQDYEVVVGETTACGGLALNQQVQGDATYYLECSATDTSGKPGLVDISA